MGLISGVLEHLERFYMTGDTAHLVAAQTRVMEEIASPSLQPASVTFDYKPIESLAEELHTNGRLVWDSPEHGREGDAFEAGKLIRVFGNDSTEDVLILLVSDVIPLPAPKLFLVPPPDEI